MSGPTLRFGAPSSASSPVVQPAQADPDPERYLPCPSGTVSLADIRLEMFGEPEARRRSTEDAQARLDEVRGRTDDLRREWEEANLILVERIHRIEEELKRMGILDEGAESMRDAFARLRASQRRREEHASGRQSD